VTAMCRVLGVSRSGYYDWLHRKPSRRELDDRRLTAKVRAVFEEHQGRLGEPRLRRVLNERVSKKRVARLMRENGLVARRKRKFVRTTIADEGAPQAPNMLARNFTVDGPNKVWVGDITYIPTRQGWLYLAFLVDLFSRAVIAWKTSRSLDASLVVDTLQQAIVRRRPQGEVIVHHDRGAQYTSAAHVSLICKHGFLQSMSRKGDCWDNAVAESFISSLKTELGLIHHSAPSHMAARATVAVYIEQYYNRRRPHSTIGYMSPLDYEHVFRSALGMAA